MRKKIAFQIAAVVAVIMFLFQLVSSIMLARSAHEMYTKGKDELLSRDLKAVQENFAEDVFSPHVLAYYEEHMEEVKLENDWSDPNFVKTSEELDQRFLELKDDYPDDNDFLLFTDEEKAVYARIRYKFVSVRVDYYREFYDVKSFAIIDISEENRGRVVCDGTKGTEDDAFIQGVVLAETRENGTIFKFINGQSTQPEFGNVSVESGEDWFVGYYPMFGTEDSRFALCLISDLTAFNKTLTSQVMPLVYSTALLFVLAVGFLMWFLYRKTVRPVAQIQKSVRQFTDNKDTDQVVAEMEKVKVQNEFGILAGDISHLAEEIERYTKENISLAAEHERMATELDLATKIQLDALPAVFPAFPEREEFDIHASMTAAKEVGGDFYDFFLLDEDHLGMVIADVSGKGVPAALFMMMAKILIENHAKMGLSPKEVLERTNEAICRNNKEKMFVTVWFGILEISTGKITAANAGHEYPIIRQPDGAYELFKDKHGFVLGAMQGKRYHEYELTLPKGSMLFVYTDGVPEATRADNEMFGTERLVAVMNRLPESSPKELLAHVHASVNEFVGDAPQFDDLTMLAVKLQ